MKNADEEQMDVTRNKEREKKVLNNNTDDFLLT
jgi:hypothetical protein